jgi:hypothetical protein
MAYSLEICNHSSTVSTKIIYGTIYTCKKSKKNRQKRLDTKKRSEQKISGADQKIQTGDVVPGRVLHTSFPASNVTITTGSDRSHIFSRPPPIDGTTHFLGWIT